jgi:hypothetical protein
MATLPLPIVHPYEEFLQVVQSSKHIQGLFDDDPNVVHYEVTAFSIPPVRGRQFKAKSIVPIGEYNLLRAEPLACELELSFRLNVPAWVKSGGMIPHLSEIHARKTFNTEISRLITLMQDSWLGTTMDIAHVDVSQIHQVRAGYVWTNFYDGLFTVTMHVTPEKFIVHTEAFRNA